MCLQLLLQWPLIRHFGSIAARRLKRQKLAHMHLVYVLWSAKRKLQMNNIVNPIDKAAETLYKVLFPRPLAGEAQFCSFCFWEG